MTTRAAPSARPSASHSGQTGAIILPDPHPGQQAVMEGLRRFNWLCAGRRWRKTTLGMPLMVADTLAHGGDFLWGAPTYKQVRVGWDELRAACAEAAGAVVFNETRLTATFPNRAVGHFVSLDNPDNARGLTAHRVVIDEAADVPNDAWYSVIRPMLMDTDGWALPMGTPKGRNWFWVEWEKAGERSDSARWQIPSLGARIEEGRLIRAPHPLENPALRFDELRQMFETMPERVFQQEILAQFLEDVGGVFRGVRACVAGRVETGPAHPTRQYVIGVDLAKSEDYTVCVVGDLQARQVVAFDRFNRADWGLQKQRIADLALKWNNALIWLDATGLGDPIYDDLRAAGLRVNGYKLTHASKTALINNAVLLVEQRQVTYPDIPVLLSELSAYQYHRSPSGAMTMSAPEGMHDDAVIAFALACWPLGHQSAGHLSSAWLAAMRSPETEIGGLKLLRRTF